MIMTKQALALLLGVSSPLAAADCSWVKTCGPRGCPDCKDDGSAGYRACCGQSPSPPSPPAGPVSEYCPNAADDFQEEVEGPPGTVTWHEQGWHIQGQRRVSSKASFDLRGGSVEWNMDLSSSHGGVNSNFYVTFPRKENCGISCYCDSGATGGCAEMDYTENNGGCFQATTWHEDPSGGDKSGHGGSGGLSGGVVHMKATYSADGSSLSMQVGGNQYSGDGLGDLLARYGAVIYSSQWVGWVPGSCGGDGNLQASSFSVSDVRIVGRVVQGPEPRKCGSPTPSPPTPPSPPSPAGKCSDYCASTGCDWTADYSCPWSPSAGAKGRASDDGSIGYDCCCVEREQESQPCGGSAPTPAPVPPAPTPAPAPSPSSCPGGSLAACIQLCPTDPAAYQICTKECVTRCGASSNHTSVVLI